MVHDQTSDSDQSMLAKSAYLVRVLYSIVDDSIEYEPRKEPPHIWDLRFYAPGPFLSFLDSLASLGFMLESRSVTQRQMFSSSWAYLAHILDISCASLVFIWKRHFT